MEDTSPVPRTSTRESEPNLLTIYGDQIGNIALLGSQKKEVELAKRIEAGVYAGHILETAALENQPLNKERAADLRLVAQGGAKAKAHMIEANLRLVVSVSNEYRPGRTLAKSDLIQQGNLGLIRAVEKFDYTKGIAFATYATPWIRAFITEGFEDQDRTIRLPEHRIDEIRRINDAKNQLDHALGRASTKEEVAAKLGISLKELAERLVYKQHALSLEQPVEGAITLWDQLETKEAPLPSSAGLDVSLEPLMTRLKSGLHHIPAKQRKLIEAFYGLDGKGTRSLEELAEVRGTGTAAVAAAIQSAQTRLIAVIAADASPRSRYEMPAPAGVNPVGKSVEEKQPPIVPPSPPCKRIIPLAPEELDSLEYMTKDILYIDWSNKKVFERCAKEFKAGELEAVCLVITGIPEEEKAMQAAMLEVGRFLGRPFAGDSGANRSVESLQTGVRFRTEGLGAELMPDWVVLGGLYNPGDVPTLVVDPLTAFRELKRRKSMVPDWDEDIRVTDVLQRPMFDIVKVASSEDRISKSQKVLAESVPVHHALTSWMLALTVDFNTMRPRYDRKTGQEALDVLEAELDRQAQPIVVSPSTMLIMRNTPSRYLPTFGKRGGRTFSSCLHGRRAVGDSVKQEGYALLKLYVEDVGLRLSREGDEKRTEGVRLLQLEKTK